ncbi:hypothetical protein TNIN_384721 [Trichonephila inaurata madagascariensis]|uniref:Uncharacterized protein n=1 Tax=Trichonephila inaurata madagascariensis TaxID=2747483 RepID=A0A8X6YI67_9ARAC|nr:hypothetical protein TNIN_384721 [Trichonephila inaurata madagascariensis]
MWAARGSTRRERGYITYRQVDGFFNLLELQGGTWALFCRESAHRLRECGGGVRRGGELTKSISDVS